MRQMRWMLCIRFEKNVLFLLTNNFYVLIYLIELVYVNSKRGKRI